MRVIGIFIWAIWLSAVLWAYSAGYVRGQKEITPHACVSVCEEYFENWNC